MVGAKIAVAATWLFGIGSLLFAAPDSIAGVWGTRILWFLVIAHAIECVVFLPKLRKRSGSLGANLVQTMIFGIVHVNSPDPTQT